MDKYEELYCRKCGTKTEPCDLDNYDAKTGKVNTRNICTNTKCEEHCNFHNKHIWGSIWKLQHETCQICGYRIFSGF